MSTELPTNCTDAELLYHYIGEQLSRADRETPLDELLSGFLQYRRELRDLRAKLRAAEDSSARGESKELDEIDNVDASQIGPMRVGVVRELDPPVDVELRTATASRPNDARNGRRTAA